MLGGERIIAIGGGTAMARLPSMRSKRILLTTISMRLLGEGGLEIVILIGMSFSLRTRVYKALVTLSPRFYGFAHLLILLGKRRKKDPGFKEVLGYCEG
jgi:hypothetical protein